MKKSDVKRLKVGDKLKMTYGYLANTPQAIREISKVQSNAIAFKTIKSNGEVTDSWLYLNQKNEIWKETEKGFEIWYKRLEDYTNNGMPIYVDRIMLAYER